MNEAVSLEPSNEDTVQNETGRFTIKPAEEYVGKLTRDGRSIVFSIFRYDDKEGRAVALTIPDGFDFAGWGYSEDGTEVIAFFYKIKQSE